MQAKIIAGNWKMNGSLEFANQFVCQLNQLSLSEQVQCLLFPPSVYLSKISSLNKEQKFSLGCQNIAEEQEGAFTGEISASMAQEVGASYVLAGHSERRQLYHETDAQVYKKCQRAWSSNLTPVVCIGETEAQYNQGETRSVLQKQLASFLDSQEALTQKKWLVAYEPVWAIGTGLAANVEQIGEVHHFIRTTLQAGGFEKIPLLYGGSVKPANAQAILACENVDGALIGGASLEFGQFSEILRCTS